MRGKCASATSTWCSVATSVTPRSRACCTSVASACAARVGSSADSGSSTSHSRGRRQQRARQADALALAAGQAVDPLEQLVAPGRSAAARRARRGCRAGRTAKRRLARSPIAGSRAGQHRGDDALARRQRRHLRRQEQPAAQALQFAAAAAPRGPAPSSRSVPAAAAARRPSPAAAWSCRRPTGRSPPPARRRPTCSVSAAQRRRGAGARGRMARAAESAKLQPHAPGRSQTGPALRAGGLDALVVLGLGRHEARGALQLEDLLAFGAWSRLSARNAWASFSRSAAGMSACTVQL